VIHVITWIIRVGLAVSRRPGSVGAGPACSL